MGIEPGLADLVDALGYFEAGEPSAQGGVSVQSDKVGGCGNYIQRPGPSLYSQCGQSMRLLLQLTAEGHTGYGFGDCGELYVCQCRTHLDELCDWWDCC